MTFDINLNTIMGEQTNSNLFEYTSKVVESTKEAAFDQTTQKTVDGKKERKAFASLTNKDIRYFQELLGEKNVLIDADEIGSFVVDVTKKYKGDGSIVLTPETTEQVSECLKYCNDQLLAVVPQGGNTGLVGGSVPLHDEVVVSTKKMNTIHSLDEVQGILTCDAGCILETLQNYCQERGYMMPLDLGAKGSCQIGGNLATNAGGIKFIKQGSMHANCIGLKAVLADGTIIDQMNPHESTPGGYDLKQLFIGSEGTLVSYSIYS